MRPEDVTVHQSFDYTLGQYVAYWTLFYAPCMICAYVFQASSFIMNKVKFFKMSTKQQKQLKRLVEKSFPEIVDFYNKVDVRFDELQNAKSFWSQVFVATLKPKQKLDVDIPEEVFIKIPKLTDNVHRTESETNQESSLYQTMVDYSRKETVFYSTFKNAKIPHFPTCKIYYTEMIDGEGTGGMVAENLNGKVYAIEHIPGFGDNKVLKIMEALAGFHYFTQTYKDHSFVEAFKEKPGTEVYAPNFQSLMLEEAKFLETASPENFGNGRVQNISWSFDYDYKNQAMEKAVKAFPRILVHSDLNVTNLLWDRRSENIGAIIDFQMIHEGSIAHDIVRVLTLGLSRKNREENTEKYLKHYHSTLTTLFDGNPPYTFDQLFHEYYAIFPVASNFTLFGISVYWKMYDDGTWGDDNKERKYYKKELISRAVGIVEEIEKLKPE